MMDRIKVHLRYATFFFLSIQLTDFLIILRLANHFDVLDCGERVNNNNHKRFREDFDQNKNQNR